MDQLPQGWETHEARLLVSPLLEVEESDGGCIEAKEHKAETNKDDGRNSCHSPATIAKILLKVLLYCPIKTSPSEPSLEIPQL